jgi:hypothetical protein
MKPVEILKLVLGRLARMGIPYMVGGSFASSFYGRPRTTYDADLIVDLKHEHLKDSCPQHKSIHPPAHVAQVSLVATFEFRRRIAGVAHRCEGRADRCPVDIALT